MHKKRVRNLSIWWSKIFLLFLFLFLFCFHSFFLALHWFALSIIWFISNPKVFSIPFNRDSFRLFLLIIRKILNGVEDGLVINEVCAGDWANGAVNFWIIISFDVFNNFQKVLEVKNLCVFALLSTDRIVDLDSSKHFTLEIYYHFILGIHELVIVLKTNTCFTGEELIYDIINFFHCDEKHCK